MGVCMSWWIHVVSILGEARCICKAVCVLMFVLLFIYHVRLLFSISSSSDVPITYLKMLSYSSEPLQLVV